MALRTAIRRLAQLFWVPFSLAACGEGPVAKTHVPPPVGNFPPGFLFGTAIAPYQVEGGLVHTDWYQWEKRCPDCSGESAEAGPGFWERYDVDLANAERMHNNALRLGIDWARVFPTEESFPGKPDQEAVRRYHEMFTAARARGLRLMVTLHHFAMPTWLHDLDRLDARKGWMDPETVDKFARFAGWAAKEFGADVDWWITINEPFGYVSAGWLGGLWPPGYMAKTDEAIQVTWNLIDGHAAAYDAIHEGDVMDADEDGVAAWVSIAQHSRVFFPRDPSKESHVEAAERLRYLNNLLFLDAVILGNEDRNFDGDFVDEVDRKSDSKLAGRLDFIGLNYYGASMVVPLGTASGFPFTGVSFMNDLDTYGFDKPKNDVGWAIYPEGFREVIDEITHYKLPILVTENGVADAGENQRPRFLLDHLYVLAKAIEDGIDIRGYFHWTLMDNFEWSYGYCPEFGLFHVDWKSPERTRIEGEGARVYRQIIDANTVPTRLFSKYEYGPPGYCTRLAL
ncbi:MAG: glycoside hydrolase family 1 protein [Deltaproteobacteria bacterium]|nr:glycoside hydrolase family 1 protein [Deltaproteobacteria bacterium]